MRWHVSHSCQLVALLALALVTVALRMMAAPAVAHRGDMPVTLGGELTRMGSHELVQRGIAYVDRDMPDSAMLCFTVVANRRYELGKRDTAQWEQCALALNGVGSLYHDYYYDFSKSRQFCQLALDIAQQYGLKRIQVIAINNLANLDVLNHGLQLDQPGAEDSIIARYRQAFDMAMALDDNNRMLPIIAMNLSSKALEYDKIDAVVAEVNAYIRVYAADTTRDGVLARGLCQSVLAFHNHDSQRALSLLDSAATQVSSVKDVGLINLTKFGILRASGQDQQAVRLMRDAERYALDNDRRLELFDIYGNLLDYYQEQGDAAMINKYELLYLRQKDTVLNQSKVLDMNRQVFLSQIDDANRQAELIAHDSRMKERMMWLALAFALILAALLALLFRKYRQVQENNRRLYLNNVELLAASEQRKTDIAERPKYQKNAMDEDSKSLLLERVIGVMELSDEIYQDSFSLDQLAELVQAHPNQVSRVINEVRGCNFNALLSEYRIKEACRRLNDMAHYGNQTIEAIANGVGFRSRSHFSTNFKRLTGLTPTEYQRQARRNAEASQGDD